MFNLSYLYINPCVLPYCTVCMTKSNLFLMVPFFLCAWLFPSSTLYKLSRLNYQFKIYPYQGNRNFVATFFKDFGWGDGDLGDQYYDTPRKPHRREGGPKTCTQLPRILLTVIFWIVFCKFYFLCALFLVLCGSTL